MEKTRKTSKPRRTPLIIDTDMSFDSWVAILFAALDARTDLLAVSVSGTGETHGPRGAKNAQRLLTLAGTPETPVAYGPPKPLKGDAHFPNLMRFAVDRLMFQRAPKPNPSLPIHDSVELISDILRKSKRKITIAAVGPQTNLATVLTRHPELKAKIKGVYIMGGALDVPGNIQALDSRSDNETAEWNFYCDPLAVKMVVDSGVPIFLVPLDATNQVPLTQDFKGRLSNLKSPAGKFTNKVIHLLTNTLGLRDQFYLWDPITTACAIDPALAQFNKRTVEIVTDPGTEWGRIKDAAGGTSIFSARTVDGALFFDRLLSALSLLFRNKENSA